MLTIQNLKEQLEIQGAYNIKTWNDDYECVETLAEGKDFECEWYNIEDKYLNAEITYMYAVDGVLNVEIEL